MQATGPSRRVSSFAAMALVYLVAALFFPILGFEFVHLDVDEQVINNPRVHGLTAENVKYLLTSRCLTSYYPVRALSFAADYHFWGIQPRGFKLTNGLIHLANVLLVFWLILRLSRHPASVDGAPHSWWPAVAGMFFAGFFAVHPVVVEPVTWVAGREELLAALGALGSIHFHLTARRLETEGGKRGPALAGHLGATVCCGAACLSNAVGAVVPALVTAWDLLTLKKPAFRRIVAGTALLWAIGIGTIALKVHGPLPDYLAQQPDLFSVDRAMLVPNVYWLNLKTIAQPTKLGLSYGFVIPGSFFEAGVVLGALAAGLTLWLLWRLWRRKPAAFGLVWFLVALAPTAQIMPHHIHRADRFLYLPLVGLAVAGAMASARLGKVLKRRAALAGVIAAGVSILLTFNYLSARQIRTWRDNVAVWEQCVEVAPENVMACRSLADSLTSQGRFDLAIELYRRCLMMDPGNKQALNNFALELATTADDRFRDYELAIQLARQACQVAGRGDPRPRRTLVIACNNFGAELADGGEYSRALECYRNGLDVDPNHEPLLLNLALLLAAYPDAPVRSFPEAIDLARRACELSEYRDPSGLMVLAKVYAEAGQTREAVATVDKGLEQALARGDMDMIRKLQGHRKIYQELAE